MVFAISCEEDISAGDSAGVDSKLWVNSVVYSGEEIRVYVGNTSGLNSGDIASYRSDATVLLHVNSDIDVKLDYREDSLGNKGYYFKERLADAKSGDSLSLEAWIEDSDFGVATSSTVVPSGVVIDSIALETVSEDVVDSLKVVDLSIYLGDTLQGDQAKHYQLEIESFEYRDSEGSVLVKSTVVTPSTGLVLGYGQMWNKYFNSIFVSGSEFPNRLNVEFYIHKSVYNEVKIKLNTITSDYYKYVMALDNGDVSSTNINNGVGIFGGGSRTTRTIKVD